jgi:uncharacterized protein (UPF0212 family)
MKKEDFAKMSDAEIDEYLGSIQVKERPPESREDLFELANVIASVIHNIKNRVGWGNSTIGYVECPKCGEQIQYFVNPVTKHTMGKCPTEGCLSWME